MAYTGYAHLDASTGKVAAAELPSSSASTLVGKFLTEVEVSNTTTETALMTISVPGGTLGTANLIKGKIFIQELDYPASSTCTLRLKYGGSTLATAAFAANGSATDLIGYIEAVIYAAGATNAQEGTLIVQAARKDIETNAANSQTNGMEFAVGTSTEDSTGDLNFVITAQFNIADSGGNPTKIVVANGYLEKAAA